MSTMQGNSSTLSQDVKSKRGQMSLSILSAARPWPNLLSSSANAVSEGMLGNSRSQHSSSYKYIQKVPICQNLSATIAIESMTQSQSIAACTSTKDGPTVQVQRNIEDACLLFLQADGAATLYKRHTAAWCGPPTG